MIRFVRKTAPLVTVAPASPADAAELSALAIKTYVDTFGGEFEPQELAHYLEEPVSVARWQGYLARDRVLVARKDGDAIGYVQVGPDLHDGDMIIHRLYVDATFQGLGIGTDLMLRVLADEAVRGARMVRIEVWEHNHGARRLYERFGFVHEGTMQPFLLQSGEIDGYDLVLIRRQEPVPPAT
jgi:ribosomal protein S18 acetylase RimI-like enzyme